MSEDKTGSGGAITAASGSSEIVEKDEVVSYETHRKLLGEKKKRDEENALLKKQLEESQAKEKARMESELKEKEDYKKLLELREAEKKELETKYTQLDSSLKDSAKLSAFLDKLGGSVEKQYWGLVNLDEILIDPNTGSIDEASVKQAASKFEQTYPLVIKKAGSSAKLPNDAAKGGNGKLTYSEWKALKTSKEMKERQGDVDWNTD